MITTRLTAAKLTYAVEGAPDAHHDVDSTFAPDTVALDYRADGAHVNVEVTLTGVVRKKGGALGVASRYSTKPLGEHSPAWVQGHARDKFPEELPGGRPTLPFPQLQLIEPDGEDPLWTAMLGQIAVRAATREEAKAALAEQVLAALAAAAADPLFGATADGSVVVCLARRWGTDIYTVTADGYSGTATDQPHPADGVLPQGTLATPLPPHRDRTADKDRLNWEIDACTCVENCDEDPAGACSLSGVRHTHPRTSRGEMGPCPVHPGAPGDH